MSVRKGKPDVALRIGPQTARPKARRGDFPLLDGVRRRIIPADGVTPRLAEPHRPVGAAVKAVQKAPNRLNLTRKLPLRSGLVDGSYIQRRSMLPLSQYRPCWSIRTVW